MEELSIVNIVQLTLHYANCELELLKDRMMMLDRFEVRITELMTFMSAKELIAIMYSYVKAGKGSEKFFGLLDQRVVLLIDQMTVDEIKKILNIAVVASQDLRKTIFRAVELYILKNLKTLPRLHLAEIFYLFCENAQGESEFYSKLEIHLMSQIFLLDEQQLTDVLWGFSINKIYNPEKFLKRAEEAVLQKIEKFTVKQLSVIVWGYSRNFQGSAPLFEKIEQVIQARSLAPKDCAHLLWAYVQNHPIQQLTLDKFTETILQGQDLLDSWDLSTILWAYARLENPPLEVYPALEHQVLEVLEEFSPNELIQVFRSYVETRTETQRLADETCELLT